MKRHKHRPDAPPALAFVFEQVVAVRPDLFAVNDDVTILLLLAQRFKPFQAELLLGFVVRRVEQVIANTKEKGQPSTDDWP
ncbi:MAG: hypothetical protein L0Y75_04440 [Acidobacteria bacterium]|nr:hypothetical protein [Acidobacteriota bacterium]